MHSLARTVLPPTLPVPKLTSSLAYTCGSYHSTIPARYGGSRCALWWYIHLQARPQRWYCSFAASHRPRSTGQNSLAGWGSGYSCRRCPTYSGQLHRQPWCSNSPLRRTGAHRSRESSDYRHYR